MRKLVAVVPLVALAFAACDQAVMSPPDAQFAVGTAPWTGHGTMFDEDGVQVIQSIQCDEDYTPYIHWVLTINNADSAKITINGSTYEMFPMGNGTGAFHYISDYYDLETLVASAQYWFEGRVRGGGPNLVISNGCPGDPGIDEVGAWCSPGYWGNRTEAIWEDLTGFNFASMFNGNVSPTFYPNNLDPDQTIWYVIDTTPPVAGAAGPLGLDARNAAAAFLTSALDGFVFDPGLMDVAGQVCPFNAHGEPDPDFYANE
jgi:hypothetical protein